MAVNKITIPVFYIICVTSCANKYIFKKFCSVLLGEADKICALLCGHRLLAQCQISKFKLEI